MTPVHHTRNTAQAISPAISVAQPLDTRTADCASAAVQSAGSEPSRRRWRESVKAIAPRAHVVKSAPSTPKTGRETAIQNLAPEEWRPRHLCSMTMDRALREMEFPSRLAGAEWVVDG